MDSDLISILFLLFHFGQTVVGRILLGFLNCEPPHPPVVQTVKNLPAILETQVRSLGREHPLKKGMAIHSNILAWRIPGTEEPSGLQSTGHKELDMTQRLTLTLPAS